MINKKGSANKLARRDLEERLESIREARKKAQEEYEPGEGPTGVQPGFYQVIIDEDEYRLFVSDNDAVLDIISKGSSDQLIFSNSGQDYPDRYTDIFESVDVSSPTAVTLERMQELLNQAGIDYRLPELSSLDQYEMVHIGYYTHKNTHLRS